MHRSTVLLIVAFFLMAVLLPACSEKVPTQEDAAQVGVPDNATIAQEQMAERYEYWIGQMDSFVHQDDNGIFVLDRDGFLRSLTVDNRETLRRVAVADTSNTDAKIILGLIKSVEAGNEQLASKAVMGSACWSYWWGRRCCYWGREGWMVVGLIQVGSSIPPWGWLLSPYAATAAYYMGVYGGFCANSSWAWPAAIWLTRP